MSSVNSVGGGGGHGPYVCSSCRDPDENGEILKVATRATQTSSAQPASWEKHIFRELYRADAYLDRTIPNSQLQEKIDQLGREIEAKFVRLTHLEEFNTWLKLDGKNEDWYHQLAIFLAKLPIRSARNIIQLLYTTIKEILYCAVHPMKGMTELARLLTSLV
nr:hypothetical protein [Chlamydiota bacterium]